MFCHKCGTEIAEGAEFCHKCGTKVATVAMEPASMTVVRESAPVQEPQQAPTPAVMRDDSAEFRAFVDNHVRATTKFQSARELLDSKSPQRFKWVCFGVPAVLFAVLFLRQPSISNLLVCVLSVAFIGYLAAAFCDWFFTVRITLRTGRESTKLRANIDVESLISFLDVKLQYLHPYFHEWGQIRQAGFGVRGVIVAEAVNSAADRYNEVMLGTEFGEKPSCYIKFNIKNDITAESPGYSVGAAMINLHISRYAAIVKAAPVLQATMEYYLKYYNIPRGGNDNVLP